VENAPLVGSAPSDLVNVAISANTRIVLARIRRFKLKGYHIGQPQQTKSGLGSVIDISCNNAVHPSARAA
jgi:hypothetical protein